ncbi:MAG: transcriptional repressor LexA [Burkholderiales bacterium]|nr:transcriptional repressor LexA [Burkholderiales bacterium]
MHPELNKRQREILDFLVRTIRERGFPPTFREIAEHCGFRSTQAVSRHLEALEKKGCIQRESGARTIRLASGLLEEPDSTEHVRMVPLLGEVAAGRPILAVEDIEEHLPIRQDWLPVDESSFFLRVRGDSMAEGIQAGDLVLVEPDVRVHRAEIVVAIIEDEATVKRFYPEADRVVLRSDNPIYEDIIVSRDFRVVGRVSALVRKYR